MVQKLGRQAVMLKLEERSNLSKTGRIVEVYAFEGSLSSTVGEYV